MDLYCPDGKCDEYYMGKLQINESLKYMYKEN